MIKQFAPRTLLVYLIKGYRKFISPIFPPCCRFEPTCSAYALESIKTYGCLRGSWLAFKRLLRCHPFYSGGYDPLC
ncbi:MAG: membrane protein insertion efficiency factor YidD [bacterium]|nr:membrane protein insertion efficiency factor YidD [bacterium]